jgi:hypothetical protein
MVKMCALVISTGVPKGRSGEIYLKTDFSTPLRSARNDAADENIASWFETAM